MKRLLAYLLTAALVLGLCGCSVAALEQETLAAGGGNLSGEPAVEFSPADPAELAFEARYIRTDGSGEGTVFPGIKLISDRKALENYYAVNRDSFYLERREQVYSDSSIGFLDACDRYDERYFETHYLIFVLLEEGSGSVRHQVEAVTAGRDGSVDISITTLVPEVGTADMAQWHLILELDRTDALPEEEALRLYLDGELRWEKGQSVVPQREAEFTAPPEGVLHTPEGSYPLHRAGYSWFYTQGEQLCAVIADQAGRPPVSVCPEPVSISGEYAETVYVPAQTEGTYIPTEEAGYFLKLDWTVSPDEIAVACWQEAVRDGKSVREEKTVVWDAGAFYAKAGAYVYEIKATWEDRGDGCYGSANYYVWIRTPDHGHQLAAEPQTVEDPFVGYCGNTWTRLHVGEDIYAFMYGNSVTLTDILLNLDYRPGEFCRCMAEYTVDTEFGLGYEVNLTEGFARCEKGQASLTEEQVEQIRGIIQWAVTTDCEYPVE